MSAETTEALERSVLESKDREQLLTIASALGVKAASRAKKADIIDKIIQQTSGADAPAPAAPTAPASSPRGRSNGNGAVAVVVAAEPTAEGDDASSSGTASSGPSASTADVVFDEPPAEWELTDGDDSSDAASTSDGATSERRPPEARQDNRPQPGQSFPAGEGEGGVSSRRRRRRNRDRSRTDGPQGSDRSEPVAPRQDRDRADRIERPAAASAPASASTDDQFSGEPVSVSGYLDLRDEGYGFLRVNGYLPSRDDVYVSVKQSRQYGLRKGDHVNGLSRPMGRNEKNPALLRIDTVNGADPERIRNRPRFEDLTPLFPDEKLHLESVEDQGNMTARIVDLVSPIGKGQRGLIVSPPKAGKTTIMKTIATAIERNNPEVKLMVLLIDERPEEVTDMRRTVKGEVIASTFDRPSDEHTHLAELVIERAKRMVEDGQDVVVILDGITRLSRAYNLAAPATGRIMSGGIDAGALYPPKKFFGAARNIEEGGSLTILATALVETNSRMDDAIFEEFKGTGNMELRLDRKMAERRIFPAIDVDASSTRHEELLFDRKQLQMVWKLRRVLSGLAEGGSAAAGLELLIDRLKTFRTNDEFLNEIAKQPSV